MHLTSAAENLHVGKELKSVVSQKKASGHFLRVDNTKKLL